MHNHGVGVVVLDGGSDCDDLPGYEQERWVQSWEWEQIWERVVSSTRRTSIGMTSWQQGRWLIVENPFEGHGG